MRRSLSPVVLASLALMSCNQEDQPNSRNAPDSPVALDAAEEGAPSAGPGIAPTSAPGVAFNYRYAFRLPANRIAGVQEEHAQACEKLGINRCRITGMRYRLVHENDIEAMLAFKLDPVIAREFGKTGIEAVKRSDGMLIDSEITGIDAGAAIKSANRADAQLSDELGKIEVQLQHRGLPAVERERLQSEAQQLRQSIRTTRDTRDEQEESLATTPMVFEYASGDLVPGFDARSPVRDALERAGRNFIAGVSFLFILTITLLPWALVAALGWWLFRLLRRKWPARSDTPDDGA